MNKICTSIEQSKKLIELGVDINTADMFWDTLFAKNPEAQVNNHHLVDEYDDEHRVPAWSLTALLSLIKPVNDNSYTLIGTLDGGAMISFEEVTNIMFQEEEIIDAVFEMIVWLKENNKI